MAEDSSNDMPTILVLEDDAEILDEISESLSDDGFHTLGVRSIAEAWETTERHRIDLFLVDLNLPDGNGLNLAKAIREKSDVGIIIVTGKTEEIDRVVGLEIGADDYISKPFSPRELLARVRAVLRRTKGHSYPDTSSVRRRGEVVEFSDWTLDLAAHHLVSSDGKDVDLTTAEFELLRAFVESSNRVLSRDFLLDRIHGHEWGGYDRGVDGLVSRLRRKISARAGDPQLIKTVRGAGYMFTPKVKKR